MRELEREKSWLGSLCFVLGLISGQIKLNIASKLIFERDPIEVRVSELNFH